jgi:hypothetical protein
MRLVILLLLTLAACSGERQPEEQAALPEAAAPGVPAAAAAAPERSPPVMPIPDDPEALKRLEAMGYTVHAEQGHLHAPGVASCPMSDSTVM